MVCQRLHLPPRTRQLSLAAPSHLPAVEVPRQPAPLLHAAAIICGCRLCSSVPLRFLRDVQNKAYCCGPVQLCKSPQFLGTSAAAACSSLPCLNTGPAHCVCLRRVVGARRLNRVHHDSCQPDAGRQGHRLGGKLPGPPRVAWTRALRQRSVTACARFPACRLPRIVVLHTAARHFNKWVTGPAGSERSRLAVSFGPGFVKQIRGGGKLHTAAASPLPSCVLASRLIQTSPRACFPRPFTIQRQRALRPCWATAASTTARTHSALVRLETPAARQPAGCCIPAGERGAGAPTLWSGCCAGSDRVQRWCSHLRAGPTR